MWPSVLQIIYLLWMQTTKHFILLKSDVCKVMRHRKVTHVALQVGTLEAQTKDQQISPRYHDGDDRICAFQIGKWFRGDCGNCPPSKQTSCFGFIHTSILVSSAFLQKNQNGWFFWKRSKEGGGLIFNPEIYIVDFVPLNRFFFGKNCNKIFRKWGGPQIPKIHPFW